MQSVRAPQSRSERLVASGRLFLALSSFAAVFVDPTEPTRFAEVTYGLFALYSVYAAVMLVLVTKTSIQWRLASHILDLIVFTVFNYLTAGPSSPFYVFFIFSLLCATLRFRAVATLYTAAAAGVAFVGSVAMGDPSLFAADVNRYVVRAAYLVISALFLFYLARYQETLLSRWRELAAWPHQVPLHLRPSIESMLKRISKLFGSSRVEVVWEEHDEPFTHRAFLDGHTAKIEIERTIEPEEVKPPLDADLVTEFEGQLVRGRLFVWSGERFELENFVLAELAARLVGSALDHHYVLQRVRHGTATDERARLGRDLHDWLLQSLAGTGMQLQSLHTLIERSPDEARARIQDIQRTIAADQRELRSLVERLQLRDDPTFREVTVAQRLQELALRFRRQWGIDVELDVDPLIGVTPSSLQSEVYALVAESVANSAKHSGAKTIEVRIDLGEDAVEMSVLDDGRGFPFHGRYELEDLVALQRGPVTLRERVQGLNGFMTLESGPSGSKIVMRIPFETPVVM